MGEAQQVVQLDLSGSFEEMAGAVIQACFPEGTPSLLVEISLAEIVEPWVEMTWVVIRHAMVSLEFEDEALEDVRKAVILATWRQVVCDLFNQKVVVVEKGSS